MGAYKETYVHAMMRKYRCSGCADTRLCFPKDKRFPVKFICALRTSMLELAILGEHATDGIASVLKRSNMRISEKTGKLEVQHG